MIQQIQSWEMERHENRILKRYRQSHVTTTSFIAASIWQQLSANQFSSVQSFSHVQFFVTPSTAHTRLPCPSPALGTCSNSCPSSQWCHLTISSSVIPFSLLPSIYPSIRVFPMSKFFTSRGQSIGVSASASVLPMDIQNWFHLGWTGSISI